MRRPACSFACLILAAATAVLCAQTPSSRAPEPEARAARAYQSAVQGGPLSLRAFLAGFPKGADLHVHLSGAVYAETLIFDAGVDGLCVDTAALSFTAPPCDKPTVVLASRFFGNLSSADQALYDRLIDSFSMRGFVPTPFISGHDQFFSTFGRFSGLSKRHTGEWVDEVASRAAAQNQQYLELMETPPFTHAKAIAGEVGLGLNSAQPDFAQVRQALLDHGLRDEVAADRDDARSAETQRRQIERCGTAQAAPACQVEIRYIYQILRGAAPEQVFAQIGRASCRERV